MLNKIHGEKLMKTIAIYMLTLLFSFDALAIESGVSSKNSTQEQISQISSLTSNPQTVQTIYVSQETPTDERTSTNRQDELFIEISVYLLIILVYWFYWQYMKWL